MKIGFLGIGLMGAPMAHNLITAGYDVTVWNRTREKAEAVAGAIVAGTPVEAVKDRDVVITMLSDGPSTRALLDNHDLLTEMSAGALMIDMASIAPSFARAHAEKAVKAGISYIDAPVSGGTRGAKEASLAIMAGGSDEDFARAEPVLRALGRPTRVGPQGAGQLVKLANQLIVAVTISAVAEAMLLVERGGGDIAAMREALMGGFADSRILTEHGARMIERNFVPGGKCATHLKDLRMIADEAEALGVELPFANQALSLFDSLCQHFDGNELDHSAALVELERMNDLNKDGNT